MEHHHCPGPEVRSLNPTDRSHNLQPHFRLPSIMLRTLLPLLLVSLGLPGLAQAPFTYALVQDTNVNITRPRVFEPIGPDLYRVVGGSGNNDSSWTYCADIDANGSLSNMHVLRCGVNTSNAMPTCIIRTTDGGTLTAFSPPVVGTNAYAFVRTDANGEVLWYRDYPDVFGQLMLDSDKGLVEKDGHYFTFGRVTSVPPNQGSASTMVELDSVGACVVQRTWAGGDAWSNVGNGVVRTAANGLLTLSLENPFGSSSSYPNLSLQHWNAAMQVEWSNRYSLGYYHSVVRPMATSDGGSLIMGVVYPTTTSPGYAFFLRLDAAGQVLWARLHATGLTPNVAVEEPDGSFAVTFFKGGEVPVVARLNNNGALNSAQRATGFDAGVLAWGIARDSITGEHLVRASGGPQNTTYLLRLDSALAFACESTPITWADSLVTPSMTPFPVTVTTAQLASSDTIWASHPKLFTTENACLATVVPEAIRPQLQVWPVPADDVVHVAWSNMPATTISYTLLDATGRLVRQGSTSSSSAFTMDMRQLGVGTYVLRMEGAGLVRAVKVVK